jgi:hypothetical protein
MNHRQGFLERNPINRALLEAKRSAGSSSH